jgi:hypothetical protein
MRGLLRRLFGCVALFVLTLGVVGRTEADPIPTFLQFTQAFSGTPWQFSSVPGTGTFTVNTEINATWLGGAQGVLADGRYAVMMTATTNAPAMFFGPPLNLIDQPFNQQSSTTLRITDVATHTMNFLTAVFTGDLQHRINGSTGELDASTQVPNQFVRFTSDFLNFLNPNEADLIFGFSSFTGGNSTQNGFISDFMASGTGSFDADVEMVPEPATLTLAGFGCMGMVAAAYLRRRGSQKST